MKALLKMAKFVPYIELVSDIVDAIQSAKKGKSFNVSKAYKVNGETFTLKVSGEKI